jgi:LSD1 subclass zinc finger protein
MRRLILPALFVSANLLLMSALPAFGGDAGDAADSVDAAAQYKKGATSYRKRCARCHGVNMVNPGPGIFDLRTFPHDDKNRFVIAVVNGKNAMPSWGDVLDAHQIDDLWVYVTGEPNQ